MGEYGEIVVELVPHRIDNITSQDFDPEFWKDPSAVQSMLIQECEGVYVDLPTQYQGPINVDYIDQDHPLISGPADMQMMINLDDPFTVFLPKEAMLKSGLSMTMARCPTVNFQYAGLEEKDDGIILLAALQRFYIREQQPDKGLVQVLFSEAADPHSDRIAGGLALLETILPSGTAVQTRSDYRRHLHVREYHI